MHDKAAKKIADGELARKGRALQSIKDILGLDDQAHQAFLDGLTEAERNDYDAEVERYMELCTVMSGTYLQWSSQLLLDAPETVASEGAYQSSLIAPLGAVLLNALAKASGNSIPQYLRNAAEQISRLAEAKRRFLVELFEQLRSDEKEAYRDLLTVCDPLLCAMPELSLYATFYRLDLAWMFRFQLLAKPADGQSEDEFRRTVTQRYQRVTRLSTRALQRLLTPAATGRRDSLAARLMLATMVNRSHWELLEYERYERIATGSLTRLVKGLQTAGYHAIPAWLNKDDFEQWLTHVFATENFADEEQWRALKPQHLARFHRQAAWILQWERLDFVEHSETEECLLNMCVLHLVWSYCTREKHDLRVPDVKDYDLVSGRDVDREQVPLTRIMYQQRQLNTMLRSHQHYALDPRKLEMYTESNRDARRQRMHYLRSNLRGVSLAQWRALETGVWEILGPLLLGQGESVDGLGSTIQ